MTITIASGASERMSVARSKLCVSVLIWIASFQHSALAVAEHSSVLDAGGAWKIRHTLPILPMASSLGLEKNNGDTSILGQKPGAVARAVDPRIQPSIFATLLCNPTVNCDLILRAERIRHIGDGTTEGFRYHVGLVHTTLGASEIVIVDAVESVKAGIAHGKVLARSSGTIFQ